ncbi:MAG: amphi-Trp domain-containing protein, partial [Planctomycetota bacterium]
DATMPGKADRDIERGCPIGKLVPKLRCLADDLAAGEPSEIQIAAESIYVPVRAVSNIEHEREDDD